MKGNTSLSVVEQKVVAVPDVRTFEASEGDYIFMACDGEFSLSAHNCRSNGLLCLFLVLVRSSFQGSM